MAGSVHEAPEAMGFPSGLEQCVYSSQAGTWWFWWNIFIICETGHRIL